MNPVKELVRDILKEAEDVYKIIHSSSGQYFVTREWGGLTWVLDDAGDWIPGSGMVHSSDWHGVNFNSEEEARANANKYGVMPE